MKIIGVDNFNREHVADILVAENVPTRFAKEICEFMQTKYGGNYAPRFYKVVEDDYKLWRGMEELV